MTKKTENVNCDITADLLRDLLVVEPYKAHVPQLEIREILCCDVHRASKIAKALRKAPKTSGGGE